MSGITPNKGPWNTGEDAALRAIIASMTGTDCDGSYWVKIASIMGCRSAKQCRERWHQSLKPGLNHGPITPQEADIIVQHVHKYGQQWAKIARELPGRSDNMIKNWWNGSANRRLKEQSHVANQAASVAIYDSYPGQIPPEPQRRATAPYPSIQHEYRPSVVEPYHTRATAEQQRTTQESFGGQQLLRLNTDSRRATIPHTGYQPYSPAHQENYSPSRLQDSRAPVAASHGQDSKRPILPPIHNLFQPSPPQASIRAHPPVSIPLATPQLSPTDTSPKTRDSRVDSIAGSHTQHSASSYEVQHYHNHLPNYSAGYVHPWRRRAQSLRSVQGEVAPTIVTAVTTSPPTEVPNLVRESAASDSPPFRSPITPAYPTFPPGVQGALGEPQQRNNSTGSSVGCPHHSRRCSCTAVQVKAPPIKSLKRERDEQLEGLSKDQEAKSAKRHCGGKMDLKLVTN